MVFQPQFSFYQRSGCGVVYWQQGLARQFWPGAAISAHFSPDVLRRTGA